MPLQKNKERKREREKERKTVRKRECMREKRGFFISGVQFVVVSNCLLQRQKMDR